MNNLIEAIKQYQQDKSLSDNQFTKLLKIDRSTWAYIKCGKRNPGMKFLRAIARELPQFIPFIYVEITDTDLSTPPSETPYKSFLAGFRRVYDAAYYRFKNWFCYPKAAGNTKNKKS